MKEEKRWLTPNELEELFDIKRSTQAKLRMKRKIPFSKFGKFIRYDKYEIDRWLENHKVVGT